MQRMVGILHVHPEFLGSTDEPLSTGGLHGKVAEPLREDGLCEF
jgi:hypothetical protein